MLYFREFFKLFINNFNKGVKMSKQITVYTLSELWKAIPKKLKKRQTFYLLNKDNTISLVKVVWDKQEKDWAVQF
jgi:hypothetical protein